MQKFNKERQRITEEKAAEILENRKDLYEEGMETLTSSSYSNMNISKIDLISYVQNEILLISPVFAPIILKPIQQSGRDFIVSSNGLTLTVGKRFFTEKLEVVIAETLKIVAGISLGHYMLTRVKDHSADYRILISFAMREAYTRVLNTLLVKSPLALGIVPAKLKFTQETIDKCFGVRTDNSSPDWRDIPNSPIQKAVEEVVYDFYKHGDQTQNFTCRVRVPHMRDTITFVIPANLIENYRRIKDAKEQIKNLDDKNEDFESQRRQQERNQRHQKKEQEEEEKKNASQDQEQYDSDSTSQGHEAGNQGCDESPEVDGSQERSSSNLGDRNEEGQNSGQNQSQGTEAQGETSEAEQGQYTNQQQEQGSNQGQQESQQDQEYNQSQQQDQRQQEQDQEQDQQEGDFEQEQYPADQNSSDYNPSQDVQGFDDTIQPSPTEPFEDSLEDYSPQEILDMLNQMLSNMDPQVEQDLNDAIKDKDLRDVESVMNELKDMAKQDPELHQQIQDAIEQTFGDSQQAQDLSDKFSNFDSDNISDMTQEQLNNLVSQIAGDMSEEELQEWNEQIQNNGYSSYRDAIEDLLDEENDFLSEETRQSIEQTIQDALDQMQEPFRNSDQSNAQNNQVPNEAELEDLLGSWEDGIEDEEDYDDQEYSSATSPNESSDSSNEDCLNDNSNSMESMSGENASESNQMQSSQQPQSGTSQSQSDWNQGQSQSQGDTDESGGDISMEDYADEKRQQLEDIRESLKDNSNDELGENQSNSPTDTQPLSDAIKDDLKAEFQKQKELTENQKSSMDEITQEQVDEWKEEYKAKRESLESTLDEIIEGLGEDMSDYLDTIENMECDMTEDDFRDMLNSMNDISNHNGGTGTPTLANRSIVEMFKVNVTWYKVLESMIKKYLPKNQPTFRQPNKKFLHQDIILPSNRGKDLANSIDYIKLFLDSSGSMTDKDLAILCGILHRLEGKFPKKTEAYEFNSALSKLKIKNGKLLEKPKTKGGTEIAVVLDSLKKKESGRVLSIVVTDGGLWGSGWEMVRRYMEEHPREKMVFVLTQGKHGYERYISTNLGISKNRFKIIPIENDDLLDINVNKF